MRLKLYTAYGKLTYNNVKRFNTHNREYEIIKKNTEVTLKKKNVSDFEINHRNKEDREIKPAIQSSEIIESKEIDGTEFKKVKNHVGQIHYFKDNEPITKNEYKSIDQ